MHTLQCGLQYAHFTVWTSICTLYSAHFTVLIWQCKLYCEHFTVQTRHNTKPCTFHSTHKIAPYAHYTMHTTQSTQYSSTCTKAPVPTIGPRYCLSLSLNVLHELHLCPCTVHLGISQIASSSTISKWLLRSPACWSWIYIYKFTSLQKMINLKKK